MKTSRSSAKRLLRLAVCLLLLALAFHSIFLQEGRSAFMRVGGDWAELSPPQRWQVAWRHGPVGLWQTIGGLRPWEGIESLGFMGATILLGLLRWRLFLRAQGLELPLARTAEISLVAHFFNSMLLGSAGGDLIKAYYAARETHHLKAESVMTVVVDRLVGLCTTLLFAVVMMLPNAALLGAHGRLAAVSGMVLVGLTVTLAVVGLSFWGGLSRLWPGVRGRLLSRLPQAALIERSLVAARVYGRRPGLLAGALGLSILLNLACVLQIYVLARGLGSPVPLRPLLVIVPVVIFLSAIPITPNGLGVRENLYVWMLTVPEIGMPAATALSLSLLAWAGSMAWSLVGGLVYVGFRQRHQLTEVTAEVEQPPGAADR